MLGLKYIKYLSNLLLLLNPTDEDVADILSLCNIAL